MGEINIDFLGLENEIIKLKKRKREIHAIKVHKKGVSILDKCFNDYKKDQLHGIYSCTKSILSILIGIMIDKKIIGSVDEKVIDLLPEYSKYLNDDKARISLKDLLSMRSGIEWDEFTSFGKNEGIWSEFLNCEDSAVCVLSKPLIDKPGRSFNYNSALSHLLSIIIEKHSGLSTYSFALKYLFKPLGIDEQDIAWQTDKNAIVYGGHGLSLKIDDLEKIGIMLLNDGMHESNQIISKVWIDEATLSHSQNTRGYDGYGYQFWKGSIDGQTYYAAFGHAGQRVYVFKELDMIVTFLGNVKPEFGIQEKIIKNYILCK